MKRKLRQQHFLRSPGIPTARRCLRSPSPFLCAAEAEGALKRSHPEISGDGSSTPPAGQSLGVAGCRITSAESAKIILSVALYILPTSPNRCLSCKLLLPTPDHQWSLSCRDYSLQLPCSVQKSQGCAEIRILADAECLTRLINMCFNV